MYNFNAHTLNGMPVNYSQIPNFALDTVEMDTRLNATAKLIYSRLLRYASLIKKTSFKITASWLSDNLAIDRNTVSRALKSLKTHGYLNDNGIILVTGNVVDTPIALVNDTAIYAPQNAPIVQGFDDQQTADQVAQNAIELLHTQLGIRRKTTVTSDQNAPIGAFESATKYSTEPKNDAQNSASNATKYSTGQNDHVQNTASNAENCTSECYKIQHPIKNKGKNKEKNDCTRPAQNQNLANGKSFDHATTSTESANGFANVAGSGPTDHLAEVSNQHKANSVTDLISLQRGKNGKITINANAVQGGNHRG